MPLHDWTIRQIACGHDNFMFYAIDQGNVDVFESLARRITNDRHGIGAMRFDEEDCGPSRAFRVWRCRREP